MFRGWGSGRTHSRPASLAPQHRVGSCPGALKGPRTISTPGLRPAKWKSQGSRSREQRLPRNLEGLTPGLHSDTASALPRLLDIPVSSTDISPECSPGAPGPSLIFCLQRSPQLRGWEVPCRISPISEQAHKSPRHCSHHGLGLSWKPALRHDPKTECKEGHLAQTF